MGFIDRLRGCDDGSESGKQGSAEHRSQEERRLIGRMLELSSAEAETLVRLHLRFTGTVQGVGFRWTNQRIARETDETGWVRNLDDGSVEMEIQGTPDTILTHLKHVHGYYDRMGCRVWLAEVAEIPACDTDADFDVRF